MHAWWHDFLSVLNIIRIVKAGERFTMTENKNKERATTGHQVGRVVAIN